jgi:nucleotide-binding universal stress UspA family protein
MPDDSEMSVPRSGATVVIAYDGSAAARQAVADAAKIVGSARVLVATVWEAGLAYAGPLMPASGMYVEPMMQPEVSLEVDHVIRDQAEAVSAEGAGLARSLGLEAEPLAVPNEGDIARTILRVAQEHRADAIVVGSRGLGGIRARLEGSTSKGVLKEAQCAVLVVHEPDEDHH